MKPTRPESLEDALLCIDVRASLLKALCLGIHETSTNGRADALARVQDLLVVMEDEISFLEEEIKEAGNLLDHQDRDRIKEDCGRVLGFRKSTPKESDRSRL